MSQIDLFNNISEDDSKNQNLVDEDKQMLPKETQRLIMVMNHEKMNLSQFSNAIGVKIATLSHVFKGRNNPSLDIMQRVLNRFSYIDANWLISGIGNLIDESDDVDYSGKEQNAIPLTIEPIVSADDSAEIETSAINEDQDSDEKQQDLKLQLNDNEQPLFQVKNSSDIQEHDTTDYNQVEKSRVISDINVSSSKIDKILILYSDGRYEQFVKL